MVQKSQYRMVGRVCRLAAGTEKTEAKLLEEKSAKDAEEGRVVEGILASAVAVATEAKLAAEAAARAAATTKKDVPTVALKHVISQGTDETVPAMSREDLLKHYEAIFKVYDRDPQPDEECSGDQLACLIERTYFVPKYK